MDPVGPSFTPQLKEWDHARVFAAELLLEDFEDSAIGSLLLEVIAAKRDEYNGGLELRTLEHVEYARVTGRIAGLRAVEQIVDAVRRVADERRHQLEAIEQIAQEVA